METQEIANKLVTYCRAREDQKAVEELYDDYIVSIEPPQGDIDNVTSGMSALLEKHKWWHENVEMHEIDVKGPFMGDNPNQFVVHFDLDATTKGEPRQHMEEVAIYTVSNGKIIREEFLYGA